MGQNNCQPYRYNSVDPVQDNTHLIPSHYTWMCRECGQHDNTMDNKECTYCRRGRSYGAVADNTWDKGAWRLRMNDYDGNEHWELQ